ncbi:MAG: chromosomal replication initiator DnaA [Paracoccaceae bacterium]|nr:chromosomal replication initiator DnaA [Paracoccaceae bacterium]
MSRQLTFDLPARPSHARGDFFVSPSNADAVAAIDRPEAWPNGRLVLVGPQGAGKTHLAHVWAGAEGARLTAASELETADIAALGEAAALVVEDWDALTPDGAAPAFHLVNLLQARGGRLLCTGRLPPPRWPIDLPDLASRMQASGVATLDPPDDALLANLLVKLFADRQIAPEPALIPWLVQRIERSHDAAEAVVAALDRAALASRRGVTRALARRVLDNGGGVTT